jgi:lipopolysaccharide export system permease protein
MYVLQKQPFIIYKYFTKSLIQYFLIALFSLIALVFFVDLIELFRRSANKVGVIYLQKANFFDILGMASLKITRNIEQILPFAMLIGSIFCFNQWRKNNYYIVTRSSGLSLWKIITPSLLCFFIIGVFSITVLNPFSTLLNKKFENLQSIFFEYKKVNNFAFDTKGFWMKQSSDGKTIIINAYGINEDSKTLNKVNVFILDNNAKFEKRVSAKNAKFEKNNLQLSDASITNEDSVVKSLKKYNLIIDSSSNDIGVSILEPDSIFIINLPNYILNMKKFGLNTSNHLIHLFKLICQPLLLISMILLSASLMLRSSERKVEVGIVSLSLVVGFSLYFVGDFMFALGSSERLHPILSGFGPTLIGLFSGCYLISDIDEPK